jgi:hypothetical protein
MADFTWSAEAGRFRDASGRFVPEARVRAGVDALADMSSDRMADLAARLRAGTLPLADWQAQMMAEIKAAHVAAGLAAKGGRLHASQADYGALGRIVRDEYAHLRAWAGQIADGTAPIDGRLESRARLYGQAARGTFEAIHARERKQRGAKFERNVLGGSPCDGCRAESAKGWALIGTLAPIGSRRPCLVNCRCRLIYRDDMPADVAA